MSDDVYRLLYAAYNNDVRMIQSLHVQGWRVNLPEKRSLIMRELVGSPDLVLLSKQLRDHRLTTRFMDDIWLWRLWVNSYDYDGRTALGVAASEGHLEACKYLVIHGANILHRDARGNNALDDALRENRTMVQEYFYQVLGGDKDKPKL